jgi:type II secretory pathway pseudopilin PulG
VGLEGQRASTLIEAAVVVAIVSIVVGATLGATIVATHAAGTNTVHDVLQDAAQREMRVAQDVLKYQGSTIGAASVATALPMPTGSPLAARLAIATSTNGLTQITVTATATTTGEQAVVSTRLRGQAPLPGTQIQAPGLAPAPTGAP